MIKKYEGKASASTVSIEKQGEGNGAIFTIKTEGGQWGGSVPQGYCGRDVVIIGEWEFAEFVEALNSFAKEPKGWVEEVVPNSLKYFKE